MDEQVYIDRIHEAENLTDNLEDEPANVLLQWGTSRVRSAIQGLDNEEQAGQRVNALMAVMRQINRVVGNATSAPIDDTIADLKKLLELYASTTHTTGDASPAPAADPANLQSVASRLANSPPREALLFLLDWVASNSAPTPTPAPPLATKRRKQSRTRHRST